MNAWRSGSDINRQPSEESPVLLQTEVGTRSGARSECGIRRKPAGHSILKPATAFDTIFLGGLVVATLDGLFAFTYYGLILGIQPLRIFQGVAAGLLGSAAFSGGIKTFLLGLLLHLVVATCIATVFYLVSLKLPFLIHQPVVSGVIYGTIAYLGMKFVVTPLSAIGRRPVPRLSVFLTEIIAHVFLVGLPIALLAR